MKLRSVRLVMVVDVAVSVVVTEVVVPDLGSRIRDVVLVRRMFSSGKLQGVRILEWGEDGNGEINLRATWDQGGRDPITPRRVSK
jgi:hypothetical protein